jgi:16S rRNA (uracil1498-N3)-methyltransferase
MPAHRFFLAGGPPLEPGPRVIGGDEARHAARVKRVAPGEAVEILDGQGGIAAGSVVAVEKRGGEWAVRVEVSAVRRVEPVSPSVVVLAPAPKGDRLAQMIEGLSQVGAAGWRPLVTERAEHEAGAGKLERACRIAEESSKQCGRAWTLRVEPPIDFAAALRLPSLVLADAGGGPVPGGAPEVNLLIGPEGGWSDAERKAAQAAGALVAAFGPHVMRIETAAVVAAAGLIAAGSN